MASVFSAAIAIAPTSAEALPADFNDSVVLNALRPTSMAFAPDGRIFIAEQSGIIKVFDGTFDTTPTTFADLRTQVYSRWDRGLEAIALDPQFPSRPYLYASYTFDAEIGGTAPLWSDECPSPPGATLDGCVVSGRLSRLTVAAGGAGNTMSTEKVLVGDWCQQFPSHSLGDIGFGADGSLYMSAGDGASWGTIDYGQFGQPLNPCGDPPSGVGGVQTAATGEGGALRSQDIRSSGDPLGLDGTLIRVNPDTGRPVPDISASATPSQVNAARVVAFGFRNPFRFAVRPGTDPPEVWIGDVGWNEWEEINRVRTQSGVAGTTTNNFGWPCVEGATLRPYGSVGFCQSLYDAGGPDGSPYFAFKHGVRVDPTETSMAPRPCKIDQGSAISGVEFYDDGTGQAGFPSAYDGSLFFGDYARGCIWVMKVGSNGLPDPARVSAFQASDGPVDLETASDGSLWYVGIDGTIHRVTYEGSVNRQPVARATATPDRGVAPLQVQLDARSSSDPDAGDVLSYAWDLDGDGAFDDSNLSNVQRTYTTEGVSTARVRVQDQDGASSTAAVSVDVGAPPVPTITSPTNGTTFDANAPISFSGSATDARDGSVPASRLQWSAILNHCTSGGGCHEHAIQEFDGVSGGTIDMPAHERPYYLTLTLTARDSDGLTAQTRRDIYPKPNVAPVARATATPDRGRAPLTVQLDAGGSTDANAFDRLSYAWDLDDDGQFDDSTQQKPVRIFTVAGRHTPAVRVTDQDGAAATDEVTVDVAPEVNMLPVPQIDLPGPGSRFAAGETISFSGGAIDPEDGELPPSGLSWQMLGPGCPGEGCTPTSVGEGVTAGSLIAPKRVDPYELRVRLTATDSDGGEASTVVALAPSVARLTLASKRPTARVSLAGRLDRVPVTRTVLQGSTVRVGTPALQHVKGHGARARLAWRSWSDGGERVHDLEASADTTLRARYRIVRPSRDRGD